MKRILSNNDAPEEICEFCMGLKIVLESAGSRMAN
jgi:hypothetical protein